MRSNVLENQRGKYPFRLATTSYIYPDHLLPNVAKLAPFFDEIELVLFESQAESNLPDEEEIKGLQDFSARCGIGYNVHLPIDIFLGDEDEEVRRNGVSMVRKVIKKTLLLNPSLYTLHLDLRNGLGQDHSDIEAWKDRTRLSLKEIVEEGIPPERISVETLRYPFEWIEDLIERFGVSICLDIGHVLLYGQDLRLYFEKYLARTSVIHLHGHENGVDHLGIDRCSEEHLKTIFSYLLGFKGIVSLEVFSIDELLKSLGVLEERWIRA